MARLKLTSGDEVLERELPSDATPMTLGRANDNEWTLDDEGVSRRHAEIATTEDGYVIRDLGSSNGTWVNRTRIERHVLADGDEITIGTSTLVFADPPTDDATVMVDMANLPEQPATAPPAPSPPPPAQPEAATANPPPPTEPPPPPPATPTSQPVAAAPQPAAPPQEAPASRPPVKGASKPVAPRT
ncbi:MAG: FHA domain-containing protein, partial [Holophagae bacterium]